MKQKIIKILQDGGTGVLPTDTLYGLVTCALNEEAVKRVYQIKGRTPNKPFIILISSLQDLHKFDVQIDKKTKKFLHKIWPNPVSIILPCLSSQFGYLHRGIKTLAFRMPKDEKLLNFLSQTGPLIAPSANPEGKPPAQTMEQAKEYFGNLVDFYIDGGNLTSKPSTLIKIEDNQIQVLREGAFNIQKVLGHW